MDGGRSQVRERLVASELIECNTMK